jgi:hypothetical protein
MKTALFLTLTILGFLHQSAYAIEVKMLEEKSIFWTDLYQFAGAPSLHKVFNKTNPYESLDRFDQVKQFIVEPSLQELESVSRLLEESRVNERTALEKILSENDINDFEINVRKGYGEVQLMEMALMIGKNDNVQELEKHKSIFKRKRFLVGALTGAAMIGSLFLSKEAAPGLLVSFYSGFFYYISIQNKFNSHVAGLKELLSKPHTSPIYVALGRYARLLEMKNSFYRNYPALQVRIKCSRLLE